MTLNKRYKVLIMNKRSLVLFPLLLSLSLARGRTGRNRGGNLDASFGRLNDGGLQAFGE